MKLKNILRGMEYCWHIFAILVQIGAFISLWRGTQRGEVDPSDGDIVIRIILLLVYGISLSILIFYIPNLIRIITKTPLLWIVVAWSLASFLWSAHSSLAFRRAISLLFATLYAVVLYIRFSFDDILEMLFTTFVIIILGSYILLYVKPEWSIMGKPHYGAWRGIMNHKNLFGITNLFMIILVYIKFTKSKGIIKKGLLILLFGVAIFTLIQSESATALILLLIFIFSIIMINVSRRVRKDWPVFIILLFGISIFAILLFLSEYENIFLILGRDITLTGRIPLWEILIKIAARRPFLGYGYRTFWMGLNGPSAEVWSAMIWNPLQAHNGYLSVWLELGLVGLSLIVVMFIELFTKAIVLTVYSSKYIFHEFYYFLLFVVILIFYNFTEAIVLQSGTKAFFWVLLSYMYIYLKLERGRKEKLSKFSSVNQKAQY